MRLIYNALLATAALWLAGAGSAQTTPPATTQQTIPDEPRTTPPQTNPSSTAPGQTQTTPGEASQTTPAQTGQTPSGQTVAATAADLKAGAAIYDQKGDSVGKIDSVSSTGVVVDTGQVRAEIPASSFAKNDKGLVIAMTKAELEAAAKKSPPKPK